MPNRAKLLATAFAATCTVVSVAPAIAQSNDKLSDVPTALQAIAANDELLSFTLGPIKLPPGGHLQGIQIVFEEAPPGRQVLISHDSLSVAYLAVVEFLNTELDDFSATGKIALVRQLPSDGQSPPLRHAGGFQLAGRVLAVGVEDNQEKKRSQIQFWSIDSRTRLGQLKHLTIARSSEMPKQATAGAVGLVERAADHLLAVGNWDCRAIDFYVSNGKPLADPACRFEHNLKWQADAAATADWKPDTIRGMYQSLNFIPDAAGNIFLLGFDTSPIGQDVIDLFEVNLACGPERALRKVERKVVQLTGDNHFRYASGAAVRNGKLLILSSERNFKPHGQTRLKVLRNDSR